MIGCAALLIIPSLRPERNQQEYAQPDALAALAPSALATIENSARVVADALPLPSFELTIRRGDRGEALFPLRLAGVDNADAIRVMLRDVPESAWLSSGERQDEHTWALRLADLDDLHVTLGEGTPDAFDVTVEVASQAGAQLARTIARVRLADAADASTVAAAGASLEPSPPVPAVGDRVSGGPEQPVQASSLLPPFRTLVEALPHTEAALSHPIGERPIAMAEGSADPEAEARREQRLQRPDGLSALGGPIDASSAPPPEGRTLWWKLPTPTPAPAWTPFGDALNRH